mmetsp:Transcript_11277/g.30341  ORF Transcript_11277/g.30341 Transcript_11277/m.30341 type:complete len:214 (+) Transcript_11277:1667-2308(+)
MSVEDVLRSKSPQDVAELLARGDARVSASLMSDYVFYLKNQHALLSIFCAHPLHPFSRRERAVVMFCALCMCFLLTALGAHLLELWRPLGATFNFAFAPITMLVWEQTLVTAATCECFQQAWCPTHTRNAAEKIGRAIIVLASAASVSFLVCGAILVQALKRSPAGFHFMRNFVWTTTNSWVWGIPMISIFFAVSAYREHRRAKRSQTVSSVV